MEIESFSRQMPEVETPPQASAEHANVGEDLQAAEARLAAAVTKLEELSHQSAAQKLWNYSLLRSAREEYAEALRAAKHARANSESSDQQLH